MNRQVLNTDRAEQESWLKRYYYVRGGVAAASVVAALTVAPYSASLAAALLICYPAWDACCNFVDGKRSGGLGQNRMQLINVLVSLVVATAIAAVLPDMNRVLGVFGAWAILSGLLQLGAALGRWKRYGAQWAMALSGAQSALAGGFFIIQANGTVVPSTATVAGYAAFGAFYFLVSALSLSAAGLRRARKAS